MYEKHDRTHTADIPDESDAGIGMTNLPEAKLAREAEMALATLGKLAILALREDYRAKRGEDFSLREFHDTFLALGPLPLPLVREAMLGERGLRLP